MSSWQRKKCLRSKVLTNLNTPLFGTFKSRASSEIVQRGFFGVNSFRSSQALSNVVQIAQGVFLLETFAGDLNPELNRRLLKRRDRWGRFAGFVFLVMDRVFAAPTNHPQFDILMQVT